VIDDEEMRVDGNERGVLATLSNVFVHTYLLITRFIDISVDYITHRYSVEREKRKRKLVLRVVPPRLVQEMSYTSGSW
jgi:hypothetical protein